MVMKIAHESENAIVKKTVEVVDKTVESGIKKTVWAANLISSENDVIKEYKKRGIEEITNLKEIHQLDLRVMDEVADTYRTSNALIVGAEGALLGLATTLGEGIPFAQVAIPAIITADVKASMTLLTRHICLLSTSYGYSSTDIINMPHIISAMAPTADSSDEGYIFAKAATINELRRAAAFMGENAGKEFTKEFIQKEAPQLIKLISWVAERLGIVILEKELGMLVPIAGVVLNCGLNVAFQQLNHTNAKDYFRRLYLENNYGSKPVIDAINLEKKRLLSKDINNKDVHSA